MHERDRAADDSALERYQWALDLAGQAVHIAQAAHGQRYTCPVCGNALIAHLAEREPHYFTHETPADCLPDQVARAGLARWMAARLRACLGARRSVIVTWPCPLCQQPHTADLLANVAQVVERQPDHAMPADLALQDGAGRTQAVVLFATPSAEVLSAYAHESVVVIAIEADRYRAPAPDLATLLAGASIYGGVCEMQRRAARAGVVTDPAALRQLLVGAVAAPPHTLFGTLDNHEDITHLFTLGDQHLWLPPTVWQRAVGGQRQTLAPALQIVSQELAQPDGATVMLHYVMAGATSAIAVRRLAPGEPVRAELNLEGLHTGMLTAATVARSLAEG